MKNIIFFRIAWMNNYQGLASTDIPVGGGSYIKDNKDGGETTNFLNINSKAYGYVRLSNGNSIKIENIGSLKNADAVKNITVVFFARDPHKGGEKIVGWYNNATVFRELEQLNSKQTSGRYINYHAVTNYNNAQLLHPSHRKLEIPKPGPGRSNIWYGNDKFIKKVIEFIQHYNPKKMDALNKIKSHLGSRAWQSDIELKAKVEYAAMKAVNDYFENNGFIVTYVHKENRGWDMEAISGKSKLLLEVKGLQGKLNSVELTPNEYLQSIKMKKDFRLCVVSQALDKSPIIQIFKYTGKGGKWVSLDNCILNTKVIKSARLIVH